VSGYTVAFFFFFSSRRRHTRFSRDWSSYGCSSDLDEYTDPESAAIPLEAWAPLTTEETGEPGAAGDADAGPVASEPGTDCAGPEIGRASCRERVEMGVVDGDCNRRARVEEQAMRQR